jgi:hypothetical protein
MISKIKTPLVLEPTNKWRLFFCFKESSPLTSWHDDEATYFINVIFSGQLIGL